MHAPLPLVIVGGIAVPRGASRARPGELDRPRPVLTGCALGKTASFAAPILAPNGYQISALTRGIRAHFDPRPPAKLPPP